MAKIPFQASHLPEAVRTTVDEHLTRRRFAAAAHSLEQYLAAGGERSADVLAALAYCLFEDACLVQLDEIIPRGARAQELLHEAAALTGDPARFRGFESRVSSKVKLAVAEQKQIDAFLNASVEELDGPELSSLAHRLFSRLTIGTYRQAARLFERAAAKAQQQPWADGPLHYQAFAGIAYARGTDFESARPLLEACRHARNEELGRADSATLDMVYVELLRTLAALGETAALPACWDEALEASQQAFGRSRYFANYRFPAAYPAQNQLLQLALEHDLPDIGRYLVETFETRRAHKTLSDATREQLDEARRRFVA